MEISCMRRLRSIASGLSTLSVMAFTLIPSGAFAQADRALNVGDFMKAYAKTIGIELPASATPDVVLTTLASSGVKVDRKTDMSKPLTQADVVAIGTANGIKLTTRSPQAPFTVAAMNQFFTSYGVALATPRVPSEGQTQTAEMRWRWHWWHARHHHHGHGKHKGHHSENQPG